METAHLFNVLTITDGDLKAFYTHFGAIVNPFPYICEASRGECVMVKFGEATSNNVRRWQDGTVAADGLQLVQTQSGDIVGGRDDGKSLWSLFRKLERGRRGNAHLIEEFHQPNQIRFLEI